MEKNHVFDFVCSAYQLDKKLCKISEGLDYFDRGRLFGHHIKKFYEDNSEVVKKAIEIGLMQEAHKIPCLGKGWEWLSEVPAINITNFFKECVKRGLAFAEQAMFGVRVEIIHDKFYNYAKKVAPQFKCEIDLS